MASTTEEPKTISRSAAEKAGWDFVHSQDEEVKALSETQGRIETTPALYRAERKMNGTMQQAQGATEEQVLEAITFIEQKAETTPADGPALLDVSGLPVSEEVDGELLKTVYTEEGTFTEAEWSARHRNDTVVTGDGQQVFSGLAADGNADTIESMDSAFQDLTAEQVKKAQDDASEEPLESKQVVYDTADSVDSPGQSSGGTIVVPGDVETLAEASAAMDAASHAAENERVLAAQKAADEAPAGSGAELAAKIEAEKAKVTAKKENSEPKKK